MTDPSPDYRDTPNTIPWPPLLLGGALLGAVLLGNIAPLTIFVGEVRYAMVALALAFGVDAWVFETFRRYNTEIMPHKPATALVTTGPFKFSRNPIYLGNILIIMGGFLLTGSGWFIVAAIGFFAAVSELAIAREEKHLEAKFGEEWRAYAQKVRRWL